MQPCIDASAHRKIFICGERAILQTSKKTKGEAERMSETNSVLIGRKPAMNYVLACITLFHGGAKEVSVKARGRAISLAVDVVEIVRHRFLPGVKVQNISIGTEQIQIVEEGRTSLNVSTIEIVLAQ
jgi:DNA-binding protein Alba